MCFQIADNFCGMSLRMAGVVLGWIGSVSSSIMAIGCIVLLAMLDGIMKSVDEQERIQSKSSICVTLSLHLVVSLLDLISSVFVILGTRRNLHMFFVPWLASNAIRVVLQFIYVIAGGYSQASTLLLVIVGLDLGLHCSMWFGLCSVFQDIRQSNASQRNLYSQSIEFVSNDSSL